MNDQKLPMSMNLQFFAESEGGNDDSTPEDTSGEGTQDSGSTGDQNQDKTTGEQTFTQSQLSAIAANEKKQGKQSILNLFGMKSEKEAKEQAEAFKKWQEAQKDTEQKLKDSETSRAEAEAKALAAENKVVMLMAGVNKDSIDDALAIASLKVTDDKDLSAVLEEMKKEPKYKGFFEGSQQGASGGTGTPAGHQGGSTGGSKENIGERLGKARAKGHELKKSNFFTN